MKCKVLVFRRKNSKLNISGSRGFFLSKFWADKSLHLHLQLHATRTCTYIYFNLKKKVWGIKNTHRKFHPATISYQLPRGHDPRHLLSGTKRPRYQFSATKRPRYQLSATKRSTITYQLPIPRGHAINYQLLREATLPTISYHVFLGGSLIPPSRFLFNIGPS